MSKRLLNWDDLSILSAICDTGTFAGAGVKLHLDETTIARRLARIQSQLKAPLFNAIDGKRRPSAYCSEILKHVDHITRLVDQIERTNPISMHPVGHLRLASTPAIAENILTPHLANFLIENPGITIEIDSGNENVDFSSWQADLAIRLGKPKKGAFKIRKLADIQLYLFTPKNTNITNPMICGYPDSLGQTPEWNALNKIGFADKARLVTANITIIRALLRSGKAIGILPEYLAGGLLDNPALERFTI